MKTLRFTIGFTTGVTTVDGILIVVKMIFMETMTHTRIQNLNHPAKV